MINIEINKSKKGFEEFSAFVKFDFDNNILNFIRELPKREYDVKSKEWEIPVKCIRDIIKTFGNVQKIRLYGTLINLNKPKQIEYPKGFEFKTEPYAHQIDGCEYALNHTNWILGDQQGLGKTKQFIDIAIINKLRFGYKHCLIICGINTLKWNWKSEIELHSNEECWVLGMRKRKTKNVYYIPSNKEKLEDIKNIDQLPYFIITNVESLRNKEIADGLKKLCDKNIINMAGIDEIHKCKNPSSQQSKGMLKVRPEYKMGMSGTPLLQSPMDLYIIFKWLGYEKHNFSQFKNHYCVLGGFGGYEVTGYKNLNELQEQLDSIMLRRLKKDVLDLPEKTYIVERLEMSKNQIKLYQEVLADLLQNIDKVKCSPNPLSQLIRLRQCTGNTNILSSTINESIKYERMKEIISESVSNGEKVVIFSNWKSVIEPAFELCKEYNPQLITGDVNDVDRDTAKTIFQTDDKCKCIFGTIGAMGTGLTLTAGTVAIFLDEPWTKGEEEQAVDRIHRIGTIHNVTIYILLCKDTIDERVHNIVEDKGMMADAIVDGKIANNKLDILNFLLS